jgi:hypothetical protein
VLLCKLEKIFPPGLFLPMQHMIVHLPYEVRMGGLVQYHWCYPIERTLKLIHKKCRNKARIEASIAEAYIVEVSNFTEKYYKENLPSLHDHSPRYNVVENQSKLSLFQAAETDDDASGVGSSGEAARAAKVYLRGPARLPQPPLPQNRPLIHPPRANVIKFRCLTSFTCQTPF